MCLCIQIWIKIFIDVFGLMERRLVLGQPVLKTPSKNAENKVLENIYGIFIQMLLKFHLITFLLRQSPAVLIKFQKNFTFNYFTMTI